MVAYRKSSRTGLAFLVVVLGAVGASSQESAPTESRPEEVLKKNELKRSRSIWVHEGETAALRDLRDTKELYLQFRTARRIPELNDGSGHEEICLGQAQAGEAKLSQHRDELARVLLRHLDEEIDVARPARVTVVGHGVPSNDHLSHLMRV